MSKSQPYERIGDAFSLAVERGDGPPTVQLEHNERTGRQFFKRVPVQACRSLPVASLAGSVAARRRTLTGLEPLADIAARLAVEWQPDANTFQIVPNSASTELRQEWRRVQLTYATTGRGAQRLWLVCPRCGGRCGVVYASPWNAEGVEQAAALVGCRKCLGLSDVSRQRHKTLDWTYDVMGLSREIPKPYRRRGDGALRRANGVFDRRWARVFRKLGIETD
ncbi:hypothetical protein FNU79_01235 [Deinococcus detaillensis]|uniref:Uncharacterized protein n=1 Tax=Deinococcus detaillensis TaxID=2592048 RepID=A0A553V606_9DEIO|nr:hypothetical protein [Deinococcus detaillensis]TSA87898.1 hypothetical protein FNU79_01235 [Deinococcus detaillensis]